MFFISSCLNNMYAVSDTSDLVTEWYTLNQIKEFLSMGIDIRGIDGRGIPYCKSDNVLNDFMNCIKPRLAKLKITGVTDRVKQIQYIKSLALDYGIISSKDNLSIDIDSEKILIKGHYNTILDYSSDKKLIDKIDVCDKNVTSLSRLGVDAFKHITVKVGSEVITLEDIISEAQKIHNIPIQDISYIGITPSNRMFKFNFFGGTISLKVDTKDYIVKNSAKIVNSKVEMFGGFIRYIKAMQNLDKSWGISKMSVKKYRTRSELKDKYPTIHDVYIEEYDNY